VDCKGDLAIRIAGDGSASCDASVEVAGVLAGSLVKSRLVVDLDGFGAGLVVEGEVKLDTDFTSSPHNPLLVDCWNTAAHVECRERGGVGEVVIAEWLVILDLHPAGYVDESASASATFNGNVSFGDIAN